MLFLDGATLDQLYPCRVKIGPDGEIEAAGPSLIRLLGHNILGQRFDDLLEVREPYAPGTLAMSGSVVIGARADQTLAFRGFAVPNHRGGADLLLSALVSGAIGGDTPLRHVDFAPTDNALDVLMAMHTRDALMEDARQLSSELVQARAAEAANDAKSKFLAAMSHELRTPLNAIIGYAEIVIEDVSNGDIGRSAEDTRHILTAAQHLLKLINRVLDLAKIEAGRMDMDVLQVDFIRLVRESIEVVKPAAAKAGARISVSTAPGVLLGLTDPTKLRQCLLNLLSNAIKFTPNGDIEVTVAHCTREDVEMVEIAVADSGCGMNENLMRRLFSPFAQASAASARTHGGTGLGLTITRQLAHLLGGDVTVASTPGLGSRFTLLVRRDCAPGRSANHDDERTSHEALSA